MMKAYWMLIHASLILKVVHSLDAANISCNFSEDLCNWSTEYMKSDERFVVTDEKNEGVLESPNVKVKSSDVHTRCLEIEVAETSLFSRLYIQAKVEAENIEIYSKTIVPIGVHRMNFEVTKDFLISVQIHGFMAIKRITYHDRPCHDIHVNCTSYDVPCDWTCSYSCQVIDGYKFKYTGKETYEIGSIISPLIAKHKGKKCLKLISEETGSDGYTKVIIKPLHGYSKKYEIGFNAGETKLSKLDIATPGDFRMVIEFLGDVTIRKITLDDLSCWEDRLERCTFDGPDGGTCGWYSIHNHRWSKQLGNILPAGRDHFPGKPTGHLMAFLKDGRQDPSTGTLLSDSISRNQDLCFRFWYYISGSYEERNVLTVGYKIKVHYTTLTTISNSTDDRWMAAEVTAPTQRLHKIHMWFNASIYSKVGIIAVDDIYLLTGSCPSQDTSCSFEKGLCTWSNHNLNDNWHDVEARSVGLKDISTKDHTSNSSDGHYLLLKPRPGYEEVVSATLISMRLAPEMSKKCFKFWKISPNHTNSIAIYQRDTGSRTSVKLHGYECPSSEWTDVAAQLKSTKQFFHVSIYGELGKKSSTGIAIDDISFIQERDELCNFERNNCGYEFNSSFTSWKRLVASQISLQHDISPGTSTGHLLAWDTHQYYSCVPDKLESPFLQFCSVSCVEIWLFLDKDDEVQVNIGYEAYGKKKDLLFYTGKSGKFWEVGMFDIPATEYKLVIEPSSLSSSSCIGLVAVDDIKITSGKCPKQKANCDFEKGLGTWTSSTDYGVWKLVEAKKNHVKGSPQKDHTTKSGNGHYLFLSPKSRGSTGGYANASIYSIYSGPADTARCLRLWIVSPSSTSSLVIKRVDVLSRNPTVIYTLKKPASTWTQLTVPVEKVDHYAYFEISGAVKVSGGEGIAVDDITFTNKKCN